MKISTLALALMGLCGFAMAQTVVPDSNGDGVYSMEELMAVFPDLTIDIFSEIDVDASGTIDPAELEAAEDAGLVTAS
ncbi:MAG: EF-hand domain-containing protein [Boseongicola sp.]|nr:MAG: EF-hand domain-containing protein [Boseongicola sp.]